MYQIRVRQAQVHDGDIAVGIPDTDATFEPS